MSTVLTNLLISVSVKHYLRGEEGIHYVDLYHLVKFLPSYALPTGLPSHSHIDVSSVNRHSNSHDITITVEEAPRSTLGVDKLDIETGLAHTALRRSTSRTSRISQIPQSPSRMQSFFSPFEERKSPLEADCEDMDMYLHPSRMPPKYHLFDFFPFSLLVKQFERRGWRLKGKKAAKFRARQEQKLATVTTHNIPLEITLYMVNFQCFNIANNSNVQLVCSRLLILQL